MKQLLCAAVLSLLVPVYALAQPQSGNPMQSGNAAMKYWQAIALLPHFDEKQEKLLENWNTIPLNAEAKQLLQTSQAIMKYLGRAATCSHCYWDLDYQEGPGLLLPHLAKCRTLGRLAALQIRYEFDNGNVSAGVDSFLNLMSLARNAGSDPILISILVGYAIESFALEAIAPYLPGLDKELLSKLAAGTAKLPKIALVQQAIGTEKTYMNGWLLKQMEAAEMQKPGEWRTILQSLFSPDAREKEGNQKVLDSIDTFAKAKQYSNDLMAVYDELFKAFNLPYAEQADRLWELTQQARKNNPLAVLLLPALNKTHAAQNRYQAKLALFLAALAVAEKGPDELKAITDPFGNGPFEYKQLPQGFELTSKLKSTDGKQVSYSVGK
ncbi:MAG TPA: hypothetical protein PLN21_04045 [Gemmatales bacterium]|nr:hypothetical protein [Gemmatales bacterium]